MYRRLAVAFAAAVVAADFLISIGNSAAHAQGGIAPPGPPPKPGPSRPSSGAIAAAAMPQLAQYPEAATRSQEAGQC